VTSFENLRLRCVRLVVRGALRGKPKRTQASSRNGARKRGEGRKRKRKREKRRRNVMPH
jgi:hypothetical protein